jgi:hypothetical protein
VDEVLLLSRELADQYRLEILPDSELEDVAMASVAPGGVACSSRFDDDPSPFMTIAVYLTRAMCLLKLGLKRIIAEAKKRKHVFGAGRKLTSQVDRSFRWSDSRGAKARGAIAKSK